MAILDLADFPLPEAICFAGGVALLVHGATLRERARATSRWPAVRGRVYIAEVREEESRSRNGVTTLYRPEIRYEYEVAGREYAAKRLDLLDRAASLRSWADGTVARYPVGREVTVYYDPAKPSDAVLERSEASGWALGMMVLGGAAALGAIGWAWVTRFAS